jgi:hypothetical protein
MWGLYFAARRSALETRFNIVPSRQFTMRSDVVFTGLYVMRINSSICARLRMCSPAELIIKILSKGLTQADLTMIITPSSMMILFLGLLVPYTKAAPLNQAACDRNVLSQAADAYEPNHPGQTPSN